MQNIFLRFFLFYRIADFSQIFRSTYNFRVAATDRDWVYFDLFFFLLSCALQAIIAVSDIIKCFIHKFFPLKVWREAFQKHISIFILQLITAAGMITNAQLRGSAQYHVGCGWCRFDFAMTRRGYVVNVHQIINEINSIEKFLEWNLYFRAFSLVSFGPYAHRFCPIWLSSGSN